MSPSVVFRGMRDLRVVHGMRDQRVVHGMRDLRVVHGMRDLRVVHGMRDRRVVHGMLKTWGFVDHVDLRTGKHAKLPNCHPSFFTSTVFLALGTSKNHGKA